MIVNTGHGKGKSTAAFGIAIRAVARDWRVCVIQFIKSDKWKVGEEKIGRRLGIAWLKGGDGFTWDSTDLDQSEGRARAAWQLARAAIAGGEYELVVLDEITYPMNWEWIDANEVIEAIRTRPGQRRRHRPGCTRSTARRRGHGHRDGQAQARLRPRRTRPPPTAHAVAKVWMYVQTLRERFAASRGARVLSERNSRS